MSRRITSEYTIVHSGLTRPLDLAVITDLHDESCDDILPQLRGVDAILVAGDLVQRHTNGWQVARRFIEEAPELAPVFMSVGNHERRLESRDEFFACIARSRVVLLDNRVQRFGELALGGLSSHQGEAVGDTSVVDILAAEPGFRLLLCHHPEYYQPYVRGHGIDLTISGHAHGGQIQLFGHGIYAPGQGWFPRLTHGLYDDGHLLVSRGVTNGAHMPRWGNPLELILLHLRPEA